MSPPTRLFQAQLERVDSDGETGKVPKSRKDTLTRFRSFIFHTDLLLCPIYWARVALTIKPLKAVRLKRFRRLGSQPLLSRLLGSIQRGAEARLGEVDILLANHFNSPRMFQYLHEALLNASQQQQVATIS